jgi:hypothetical protein
MTEGLLGGRQATTLLTRTTWTTGTIFMVLSLVLAIMSSRAQQPQSVIQVNTPATEAAPQPVLPGLGGSTGPAAATGSAGTTGAGGSTGAPAPTGNSGR